MYHKKLFGLVIPTITPMTEEGRLDEESTADFCEFLIKAGVDGLYPNGTNGESLLLSREEREKIAEITVKANADRVSAFIQCGSMTTEETISHAQHSVRIGADGIGIMTPAFFPMDEASLYKYYSDIISSIPSDFPVYIYNIPGCTTNDVTPPLLECLMERFTNIAGIKFSSNNLMRLEDYLLLKRRPDVLIGCDSLFLQCLMTGGVGTVTGPGSIFVERFTRLYRQFNAGDMAGAMKTQQQIVDMDRRFSFLPGIPALKALLKMRGVIKSDVCRGPNRPLTKEEYAILEKVLEDYFIQENISK